MTLKVEQNLKTFQNYGTGWHEMAREDTARHEKVRALGHGARGHRMFLTLKEQTPMENCSPILGASSNFLKMAVDNNMKEALLAIFQVLLQEFLDSDNEMILRLQKNMDDDVDECGTLLGLLDRNKIPKIDSCGTDSS